MLIFSISFGDLIKFHYFMDSTERRVWGERRPKDKVTSPPSPLSMVNEKYGNFIKSQCEILKLSI